MARYDLRKNGYFGFEPEEVKANEKEALEMFIGDFYCSEKDLSAFTVMQDVNW